MAAAPSPQEIYERAAAEGQRRLGASSLEMIATGFIAGFAIVYGIVALALADGLVTAAAGPELGKLAGALAFGLGLVFTVVARAELFTENFLDPVAATLERRQGSDWLRVARLWLLILVFNLAGGAAMVFLMTVEGALPAPAADALVRVAEEIRSRGVLASFANAIGAGALLTLLTYLLQGAGSVTGRMVVAYLVGFFVAAGPFNHVVVTVLHLLAGMRVGASVGVGELISIAVVSTVGNVLGGLLFVTLTQTVRAKE